MSTRPVSTLLVTHKHVAFCKSRCGLQKSEQSRASKHRRGSARPGWSRASEEICDLWGLQHEATTSLFRSAVLFCFSRARASAHSSQMSGTGARAPGLTN